MSIRYRVEFDFSRAGPEAYNRPWSIWVERKSFWGWRRARLMGCYKTRDEADNAIAAVTEQRPETYFVTPAK